VNEKTIQTEIMCERYHKHFVVPNYTPENWWECDVFEVTKAGYFREYEVKISRADFKADANKTHYSWPNGYTGKMSDCKAETKHQLLSQGDPRGPANFWFVTPKGLLELSMVPDWAGLIEVDTEPTKWRGRVWYHVNEAKKAPRLHSRKMSEKILTHAKGVCYWRMHNLLKGAG
jgi:hypothetical protein